MPLPLMREAWDLELLSQLCCMTLGHSFYLSFNLLGNAKVRWDVFPVATCVPPPLSVLKDQLPLSLAGHSGWMGMG